MVLDLDETLIHSHHDGIVRPMVKPGTPPDFILRVIFKIILIKATNNVGIQLNLVFRVCITFTVSFQIVACVLGLF